MIEEFDDIIEELADKLYIHECDCCSSDECEEKDLYDRSRLCWTGKMKNRIRKAVEIENKLK